MAAIKPNKYSTIYEFNYKPRNYESQKKYFKKLQKKSEFTLEKKSQRKYLPSTNHSQSPTKSKLRTRLSSAIVWSAVCVP